MAKSDSARTQCSLPTERDFDPFGGDLDAQCAWRNFGGLTLDEAIKKFRESPECYQEDFMFMGGKAFAFYFPVVESYLREMPAYVEFDDSHAGILAHGIKSQFTGKSLPDVIHLASRVLELAAFVKANIHLFDPNPEHDHRVYAAWQELEDHIKKVTSQ